ncbi:response regulator [Spirosoma arcticum]
MLKIDKTTLLKRRKADRVPVLVVENDADHWLIIRSALAQCFPEVVPVWVNNAAQAVGYLEQSALDQSKLPWLVLLELHLPRPEDGRSLIKLIKGNPQHQHIPLIVLSHSQDQQDIKQAYANNVASYIVKPTTYHQWLKCIYSFRRYWWELVTLPFPFNLNRHTSAEPTPGVVSL